MPGIDAIKLEGNRNGVKLIILIKLKKPLVVGKNDKFEVFVSRNRLKSVFVLYIPFLWCPQHHKRIEENMLFQFK